LLPLWAVVLAGCASVELDRHYEPPTILVPQAAPAPQAPVVFTPASEPAAQARPVTSGQPQPQPLAAMPMNGEPPPAPAAQSAQAAASAPSAQAPADDPDAHLATFSAHLSGPGAVPPADSAATGQIDALYDSSSGLLRWKVTWSDLRGPITAVQFRGPADSGQNAPPTVIWPAPFGPTYEGRATLTPQQARDLLSGRWYVNVSTTVYPSGELRGQLQQVN
jgi:hypothetical protein